MARHDRRRRGPLKKEGGDGQERWLVSYADMITVLMILFIVMFALSQVDQRKFNALKQGMASGFGQSTSIQDGSHSLLNEAGLDVMTAITPAQYATSVEELRQDELTEAQLRQYDQAKLRQRYLEAEAEVARLVDLMERLKAELAKHGLEDAVRTTIDNRGLVVSLVSRHVVFEPHLASLSPQGRQIVDILAPVLAGLPDPLQIDGHTNQAPVNPKYYATDWELSAARAITVLRHLQEAHAIPGERMTASAFANEKPLLDPKNPQARKVNKRVDIVILSAIPAEIRELMEDVVAIRTAEGGLT